MTSEYQVQEQPIPTTTAPPAEGEVDPELAALLAQLEGDDRDPTPSVRYDSQGLAYEWNGTEWVRAPQWDGARTAPPQLGPTRTRIYSTSEIQSLARDPSVRSISQQGFDYIVVFKDGTQQRFYPYGGGYATSAPTKAPSAPSTGPRVVSTPFTSPQLGQGTQSTGLFESAGTGVTQPQFTGPGPNFGAPFQPSGRAFSLGSSVPQVSLYDTGTGNVLRQNAQYDPALAIGAILQQSNPYIGPTSNVGVGVSQGGAVPPQYDPNSELYAPLVDMAYRQAATQHSRNAGVIEAYGYTPTGNPIADAEAARLLNEQSVRTMGLGGGPDPALLAAANFAGGGTMRVREPALLISMPALAAGQIKPLAQIGEGGFEEVMQNRPGGMIQITPTNNEITLGREYAGRIGSRPLGEVPGFQYGGTLGFGDPSYDVSLGQYGSDIGTRQQRNLYSTFGQQYEQTKALMDIADALATGGGVATSSVPRSSSVSVASGPTNEAELRAYYQQQLANLGISEQELNQLRELYGPITELELQQLAAREADQARVAGLQPIADANLLYRFNRANIEDPISKAARQIGVAEDQRRLALQGLTLPYGHLGQNIEFNEAARRIEEDRLRLAASLAGLGGGTSGGGGTTGGGTTGGTSGGTTTERTRLDRLESALDKLQSGNSNYVTFEGRLWTESQLRDEIRRER